jgi:hypothetical protein
MDDETPVVVGSAPVAGRLKVSCPWCGVISMIALLGVQALPGCGHVADAQQTRGDTPAAGGH